MFDEFDLGDVFFITVIAALLVLLGTIIAVPSPVQAKPAPIPTELNLAGSQWKVDVKDYPGDAASTLGYTRCDTHHIELKAGIADLRETLIHELLHAYVCGNGLQGFDVANLYYNSSDADRHDGIDLIGYVVTDALGRNPSLAAYLAGDAR